MKNSYNKVNFNSLVSRVMQHQGYERMRPVIEKELLHYDILYILDDRGFLDDLVFQGGTALRLCYGAQRLSEDLDFAGGKNFNVNSLVAIKSCLEQYLAERYDLEVLVKPPKVDKADSSAEIVMVKKWQILVVTAPERPDIPKQMIKIEIANIPAYTQEVRRLNVNYEFLPDGYQDTLLSVESLNEIMADKLVALPNCRKYIRYRDIWICSG